MVNPIVTKKLGEWLGSLLTYVGNFELCTFVYESWHSEIVSQLRNQSAEQEEMMDPERGFQSFASARHLLGRLADHIGASKELFKNATDVGYILQTFNVCAVEPMLCVPPPTTNMHTHPNGILDQMPGKNCSERPKIEKGLYKINAVNGVFSAFTTEY